MTTSANTRDAILQSTRQNAERNEHLLDEAVEETFPSSDPPAETQPGSIAAERCAAAENRAATRSLDWLPFAALAAGVAVAALALRRRA